MYTSTEEHTHIFRGLKYGKMGILKLKKWNHLLKNNLFELCPSVCYFTGLNQRQDLVALPINFCFIGYIAVSLYARKTKSLRKKS